MQNLLVKRILEQQDITALTPVRGKLSLIPENIARQFEVVAFDGDGTQVALITTNTFSEQLKKIYAGLEQAGYKTDVYYTDADGIQVALGRYTGAAVQEQAMQAQIKAQQEAIGKNAIAQIMEIYPKRSSMDPGEFLMQVIKFAFQAGASDLHFQAQEDHVVMRARIDGVMTTICEFNHNEYTAYVQKIKFIGGMKMNIDYLPQDGRLGFEVTLANGIHKKIDVRINTMPGTQSENIVLRYLDSTRATSTFEEIGFRGKNYDQLKSALDKHEGMILVTGPTGSGKTTTLYTILQTLNDGKRKIITLEDPVEYMIDGIEQSQINYSKGYTFEEGLKAILRHDPDIILVGETRTTETARTSLNAALTGHLVFSTLHTNTVLESISRLLMMGVEAYLLAPAIQLIIGQRLVRKVCSHCTSRRKTSDQENIHIITMIDHIKNIRPDLDLVYDGTVPYTAGCEHCNGTGYLGRTALIEMLEMTDDIKQHIVDDLKNTAQIMQLMRNNGFLTIAEDGLIKMLRGQTTMEELRRVV